APAAPAPAPAAPAPAPVEQPRPEAPPAGSRREFVRKSQAAAPPAAARPTPAAPAPATGDDDWPEPARPGAAAAAPSGPKAASAEPDIPLPPEPTDDEDWPSPARPAAPSRPAAPAATAPAPAAESAPAPRGAEPTPVVSASAAEPASGGDLTTSDARRVWPELLAVVKRHKRTTEALLKNAQVHELRNGVLVLSTNSPALARRIGDDLNKDVLREALNELLGVRWK